MPSTRPTQTEIKDMLASLYLAASILEAELERRRKYHRERRRLRHLDPEKRAKDMESIARSKRRQWEEATPERRKELREQSNRRKAASMARARQDPERREKARQANARWRAKNPNYMQEYYWCHKQPASTRPPARAETRDKRPGRRKPKQQGR